ncbi:hypothetical protein BGZ63DRAFT_430545 [Mariannaea sp. PMI_226]|nr:hypothetical protein BGZ63DRAFT_430545 [Mariannaea sp. PMI_226]
MDDLPNPHQAADATKKRSNLPDHRPHSSAAPLTMVPDVLDAQVLSETVLYHEEQNGSHGNVTHQPSSPTCVTSTAVSDTPTSNPDDVSEANADHSSVQEDTNHTHPVRDRREPRHKRFSRPSQRPYSANLSELEYSTAVGDYIPSSPRDAIPYKVRRRRPQRSPSISSSTPSAILNDSLPEGRIGSDLSWSPEDTEPPIASQPLPLPPQHPPNFDPRLGGLQVFSQPYPVHQQRHPETPRGPAPFPFFQYPQPSVTMAAAPPIYPPELNRSLAGYDLLAAKIAGEIGGSSDQLIELEETIAGMDQAEAENWKGIPVAERPSRASDHPFHVGKGHTFGLVTQKLQIYYSDTLLALHKDIQGFARPTVDDFRAYRQFLATERPITDEETMFLDSLDLVVLENERTLDPEDINRSPPAPRSAKETDKHVGPPDKIGIFSRGPFQDCAIGMILAIFFPLVSFPVFRDFKERMAIVILAGAIVYIYLLRSGINLVANAQDYREGIVFAAGYVGTMAILSSLLC